MADVGRFSEITTMNPEPVDYKEIKPLGDANIEDIKSYWDSLFGEGKEDESVVERETETSEIKIEELLSDYFEDLRSKSEYPETIPEHPFEASDLHKISPEENKKMREEFQENKAELKKQWEEQNGIPWPKYEHDVYSSNGKLIRKAGSDYDAHHIQPLGMGGKNEASNITPINAEVHYDKQGVHAPESPYSKMDKLLGGIE